MPNEGGRKWKKHSELSWLGFSSLSSPWASITHIKAAARSSSGLNFRRSSWTSAWLTHRRKMECGCLESAIKISRDSEFLERIERDLPGNYPAVHCQGMKSGHHIHAHQTAGFDPKPTFRIPLT